jgi:phosphate:Na+ symporter
VQVIFASLTGDIMLDALIGAVFAIISYSSLAAVLLTATLTTAGIISFPVALCLVIGANLGSGLLAMLNNSAANAAARRVALGSLLFKLVGSLVILPFVHLLADVMGKLPLPKAELVIYFHVFYNLIRCLAMVPFVGVMATFCERLIRDEPELDARLKPKHLDSSALDTPTLALANAARETLRMGDAMELMLEGLHKVMHGAPREEKTCVSSPMTLMCCIPPSNSTSHVCQKKNWRKRSHGAGLRLSRCLLTLSRPLTLWSAWAVKSPINHWRRGGLFPVKG